MFFKLNEENDQLKRNILTNSINLNGISINKVTDDLNALSGTVCRVQMGEEKRLRQLEIDNMLLDEINQMSIGLDECASGNL